MPLAARFPLDRESSGRPAIEDAGRPGRGFACALGEAADAILLPAPRRQGESIALALAGTEKPAPEELARLTGSSDSIWVELSPGDRGGVDDGPLAERLRTAASVSLIEGSVLEWLITLWPARRRSAVVGAITECSITGGRLIGRGSTAFLVAAGGVVRGATREGAGESRLRLENPREDGEALMANGLHLCGDFFVDTQARSNGSVLRLLSTLIEEHQDQGVHLGARSSLCCDLETRSWTVFGPDPLLVLDLRGSRRESRSLQGASLSTLAAGDGWRRLGRGLFSVGEAAPFGSAQDELHVADAFAAQSLRALPSTRQVWRDERARVELRQGLDSRAFTGPSDSPLRGQRMILDVTLEKGRWGELRR